MGVLSFIFKFSKPAMRKLVASGFVFINLAYLVNFSYNIALSFFCNFYDAASASEPAMLGSVG